MYFKEKIVQKYISISKLGDILKVDNFRKKIIFSQNYNRNATIFGHIFCETITYIHTKFQVILTRITACTSCRPDVMILKNGHF